MAKQLVKVLAIAVVFLISFGIATGSDAQTRGPATGALTLSPVVAPPGFPVVASFTGCTTAGVIRLVPRFSGATATASEFVSPSSTTFVPGDALPGDYDYVVGCGDTTATAHFVVEPVGVRAVRAAPKRKVTRRPPTVLEVQAQVSGGYDKKVYEAPAGLIEIRFTGIAGITFAFNDRRYRACLLSSDKGGSHTCRVRLAPGDYLVGDSIAGHRRAGYSATLHVVRPEARPAPPTATSGASATP